MIELIELRELGSARLILKQSDPMQTLRQTEVERSAGFQEATIADSPDLRTSYSGPISTLERSTRKAAARRREGRLLRRFPVSFFFLFVQSLSSEVNVVPPSRLLALLGQALKWQQHQGLLPPGQFDYFLEEHVGIGTQIDLFRGRAAMREQEEERCPRQLARSIKFSTKSYPQSAVFR